MNLYVGNLPRETTQEDLQKAFSVFGQVTSAAIIKDKMTGEPRGFAFVEMPSKSEAQAAMMDLKEINGRMITINEARPKESSGPRSGGGSRGGYSGGGYGGGRDSRGGREGKNRGSARGGKSKSGW